MAKDKYDFIQDILENKKITPAQKERVFALAKNEIIKDDSRKIIETKINDIEGRLNKIENELVVLPEDSYTQPQFVRKNKIHTPKETYNFLLRFTNSDYIKYLTHTFNGPKPTYKDFMVGVREEYDSVKNDKISNRVLEKFEHFAFDESAKWYIYDLDDKIEFSQGWSTKEFINWYEVSGMHPSSNSHWNSEMIKPFKNSIEVRTGYLTKIIKKLRRVYNTLGINFNEQALDNAEFYTNVDYLNLSLKKIFDLIIYNADDSLNFTVNVNYRKEKGMHNLYIIHENSKCSKQSDYEFKKGDFSDLISNLWCLGNLEIEADFEDGSFRKTILTDKKHDRGRTVKIDEVKGFTYILKFY